MAMSTIFYFLIPILCISFPIKSFELAKPSSPPLASTQSSAEYIQLIPLPEYRSPSPTPEPESQFDIPVNPQKETEPSDPFKTFWDWKKACIECLKKESSPVTKELFLQEMGNFFQAFNKSTVFDCKSWVQASDGNSAMPGIKFFLLNTFEPYALKLEVTSEEQTAFIGDIHGDISSFNAFLEKLVAQGITDPKDPFIVTPTSNVILLGDYTDRGKHGVEVLYAVSRFMRKNFTPEPGKQRVFAVRGNHEDAVLNSYSPPGVHNLYMELRSKFDDTSVIEIIEKFYNCLPLALFLKSKSNALLCDHGGIEPGFTDTQILVNTPTRMSFVLINRLYRKQLLKKLPPEYLPALQEIKERNLLKDFNPCNEDNILFQYQFLWGDYDFKSDSDPATPIEFYIGRGMKFPEQFIKKWFEINSSSTCQLVGNIRGHQHSHETMDRILNKDDKSSAEEAGVAKIWVAHDQKQPAEKLWPGIVCTLCVCPNTGYGEYYGYNFGAYCILKTADQLADWSIKVHQFDPKTQ
jgi:hypothetical protein